MCFSPSIDYYIDLTRPFPSQIDIASLVAGINFCRAMWSIIRAMYREWAWIQTLPGSFTLLDQRRHRKPETRFIRIARFSLRNIRQFKGETFSMLFPFLFFSLSRYFSVIEIPFNRKYNFIKKFHFARDSLSSFRLRKETPDPRTENERAPNAYIKEAP